MPATVLLTAEDVFDETRALLNDVSEQLFINSVLLPYLNKAYDEMQEIFEENDIPVQSQRTSPAITVPANTTQIVYDAVGPAPSLPDDLLFPVRMWERDVGSTSEGDWIMMVPKRWEPLVQKTTTLQFWTWRKEQIFLVGATQAREVKIDYKQQLVPITAGADDMTPFRAKTFLASRTALLASFMIGENETRAATLQQDAELAMKRLINRYTLMRQDTPVRRRPFRIGRGTWGGGYFPQRD